MKRSAGSALDREAIDEKSRRPKTESWVPPVELSSAGQPLPAVENPNGGEGPTTDVVPPAAAAELDAATASPPEAAARGDNASPLPAAAATETSAPASTDNAAPTLAPASLFSGSLFSQPFTNPFVEAAKTAGAEGGLSVIQPPSTDGAGPPADDEEAGNAPEEPPTARPTSFPGEENEKVIFTEQAAKLLKLVKKDDGKSAFRKVGEGFLLRILENAEGARRLVVRQRGTWNIFINSSLAMSKTFNETPAGVTFIAKDARGEIDAATLSVFAARFSSDSSKIDFLQCVRAGATNNANVVVAGSEGSSDSPPCDSSAAPS